MCLEIRGGRARGWRRKKRGQGMRLKEKRRQGKRRGVEIELFNELLVPCS